MVKHEGVPLSRVPAKPARFRRGQRRGRTGGSE
jgi:hypothetical protein